MPSWVVPSDSHSVGDTGHTTDHNHIADDLTLIATAFPGVETGDAATANNVLDDGSGNMTLAGLLTVITSADLQLLLQSLTGAASINFTGPGNGSYFSGFNLGDGVYPLDGAGHYWGIQHAEDHDFLIFNYNGATYTTVFQMGEDGSFTTVGGSTLDDGSGNAAVAGTSTVTGVSHLNGGTDTSGTAAASAPSLSTTVAAQLSTTQDVTLYANVKVASTFALTIGPTSTPATTIVASATAGVGLITVHVPKGWYVKATFTSADVAFTQVTR